MQNHLTFATELADQARSIITGYFASGVVREYKLDSSPITTADREVNDLVLDAVQRAYPDYGVVAEERSSDTSGQEYAWVCDPIDGTIPFSHGIPICAFSLALVRNGVPILGVVDLPFQEQRFVAEPGNGATVNGKLTSVSNAARLKNALVSMDSWHRAKYDIAHARQVLDELDVKVVSLGSTVYHAMLVANGHSVAEIFSHIAPWDAAAVKLIVEEAGGKVTDLFGEDQRYDRETRGYLASNEVLHEELLDIIGLRS